MASIKLINGVNEIMLKINYKYVTNAKHCLLLQLVRGAR
jgi:hypothetical protein